MKNEEHKSEVVLLLTRLTEEKVKNYMHLIIWFFIWFWDGCLRGANIIFNVETLTWVQMVKVNECSFGFSNKTMFIFPTHFKIFKYLMLLRNYIVNMVIIPCVIFLNIQKLTLSIICASYWKCRTQRRSEHKYIWAENSHASGEWTALSSPTSSFSPRGIV